MTSELSPLLAFGVARLSEYCEMWGVPWVGGPPHTQVHPPMFAAGVAIRVLEGGEFEKTLLRKSPRCV